MIEFEYIADDRLRASLVSDYAEFQKSVLSEAWKAALVLAGSIAEALLVDHLVATGYQKRTSTDPLKLQLGDLIRACEAEKSLSQKVVALSTVIQSYRNLIHPGRSVRLSQTPKKGDAIVAGELLQMIVDNISEKRRAQYGFTAAQIVAKLERDASALSIREHLLKEMSEGELERLLMKTIPERYREVETSFLDSLNDADYAKLSALEACFRSAFDMTPDETKLKVTKHFVEVIKQEDEHVVLTYETNFFRAKDLKHLPAPELRLVKEHLLSRVSKDLSVGLLAAMEGLGAFLVRSEVASVTDAVVRAALPGKSDQLRAAARKYLSALWMDLPGDLPTKMSERLDAWIGYFNERGNSDLAHTVTDIKSEVESQIPF